MFNYIKKCSKIFGRIVSRGMVEGTVIPRTAKNICTSSKFQKHNLRPNWAEWRPWKVRYLNNTSLFWYKCRNLSLLRFWFRLLFTLLVDEMWRNKKKLYSNSMNNIRMTTPGFTVLGFHRNNIKHLMDLWDIQNFSMLSKIW